MSRPTGPVLIELDADAAPAAPAAAPAVPDLDAPATGRAMQALAAAAARRPSRLARFFWTALVALVGFMASVAAWSFVDTLLTRNPVLGTIAAVLMGLFVLAILLVAGKEWLAIGRLKNLDALRADAASALTTGDLKAARKTSDRIAALYANRPELELGRAEVADHTGELFDVDAVLGLPERHLLMPLDQTALREIEGAARQVATVTAVVPLALADLVAALTCNLRMIRRVAEIYGGRSGAIGNWRLTREVFAHLVATGAVAVGDDLIGSVAGGGVLSKLSRRFGEGMINGALTARVGVAAMEVCRPLPFSASARPSVTGIVSRSLTGLFGSFSRNTDHKG